MRPLLRTLIVMTLVVLPVTAASQTLTVRDLVALNQAGLGDEVLIALIEADNAVFNLGYAEVLDLRKQGLSERVLVKMIESKTARRPAERTESAPRPVIVNQTVTQEVRVEAPQPPPQTQYVQVPVYIPVQVRPRVPEKEPEPVYWGFGGKRRPDSWQEPPRKTPPARPGGGR